MNRRRLISIHRWLAITAGLVLSLWILTGLSMTLPPTEPALPPAPPRGLLDPTAVSLSAAEAIQRAGAAAARSATLKLVGNATVWDVELPSGKRRLIDAATGEPLEVTPKMAEAIVRERVGSVAPIATADQIERHGYDYQWGPLPVYKVAFEDDPSRYYFVSTSEGTLRASEPLDRARNAFESLHMFAPIKMLTGSLRLRNGSLAIFALGSAVLAATGYMMWPRRRR